MHIAKGWAIGRVTSAGPKLDYPSEPGKHPTLSFWLEVRTGAADGREFTRYIPVQIVGKRSEEICADLEPGDECYVEGDLVYKSAGKTSDGKKAGGLVLSSWTLTKAMSTATEVSPN